MAIHIDLEPVKSLFSDSDSYSQIADNPGFMLYWRSRGYDPQQVAANLSEHSPASQAAALDQGILGPLGRISGVSIEQLVSRHLPGSPPVNAEVVFVPGDELPIATGNNTIAINVYSLEPRGNKLYLNGVHLLSLLANRVHQLCTEKLMPALPVNSNSGVINNVICKFLREGSATLFFTMPVSGPIYDLWHKAEQRRDVEIDQLRQYLRGEMDENVPAALSKKIEGHFGLSGMGEVSARYPLATYMCQVIESAFGRPRLIDLLQHADEFLTVFEQARKKFGLSEKYSLEV